MRVRGNRFFDRSLLVLVSVTSLASCADQRSYVGIPIATADMKLRPCARGQQDPVQCYKNLPLGTLANQARIGGKQAQLELGIRFEKGRGVCKDRDTALALYALAAKDTPRKLTTFIPDGGSMRAETTSVGVEKGLPEAEKRLRELRANHFVLIYPVDSPCRPANRGKK